MQLIHNKNQILAKHRLTIVTFSVLLMVGAVLRVLAINSPLFSNTDDFVLFASQDINLGSGTQISSGSVGANGEIAAQDSVLISSDLFADEVSLAAGVQVNGDVSFNVLNAHPNAVIFGATTTPLTIPIAQLPQIPGFQPGTQDSTFSGSGNILAAGSYRNIKLKKDSKLTLSGGTYNLNSLELEKNSTLIYAAPTVLNIEDELAVHQNVAVLPGQDLKPDDLVINCEADEIDFGKDSFLNFKLLAPQAEVKIKKGVTLRGQILAGEIEVDKDAVLSREGGFEKESDPEKLITDVDDTRYFVNEIMINLVANATFADARAIAELVGGIVTGFVESANAFKIEVSATTPDELSIKIQTIRDLNDPLIEGVFRNYVLEII